VSLVKHEDLQWIWGKLARELGVQELPEPVRTALLEEYEDEFDYAMGTGELEILVQKAKGFYKVYLSPRGSRKPKKSLGTDNQDIEPEVGRYESLRAAVLSEYLAKMATIDPEVVRFRNEVLDGEVLTSAEANTFLSSPASRFLTREVWQSLGIPIQHTATLVEEERFPTESGLSHFVQVRIDPPGVMEALFWDIPSHIPVEKSYGYLTCQVGDGLPKRVSFWPHSVLGNLRKLCKELVKAHPWDIDEATWFVLTGEPPLVRPIRARTPSSWKPGIRAYTTISLTVEPWVPPETVEAAYRQLQKQVIGGKAGRIGDKNLNLLRFVAERADAAGKLPKGHALVEEWDKKWGQERPQWSYGPDTRRFWRDFRDVQKSVTNSRRAGLILEAGAYTPEELLPKTSD
jgi:hypothetical protein